jgi:large subunit ribosomal protein L24
MSKAKFHIAKGDTVEVITGASRGSSGTVLKVVAAKAHAYVEGVRLITKATKPTQANQSGGLIKKEGPIHVSNLKVVAAKAPAKAKAEKTKAKKK